MTKKIILVIAVLVFLYSGYQLFLIFFEYNKSEKEYEMIIDQVITEETVKEEPKNNAEEKTEKETVFKVDFEKLLTINKETVAWIRFDEPKKISYPVVKAGDNDKYLRATFEGKKNSSGAIFMDAANMSDFTDRNTFIYGHNMKNGSMFGQLRKYKNEAFYKENPYFYIYTPDGRELTYQVFAVGVVEDTAKSYMRSYGDDEEYIGYLKHLQNVSQYKTGVEVNAESRIVSLSTCTNVTDTQRLLVHGVKINEKMVGE